MKSTIVLLLNLVKLPKLKLPEQKYPLVKLNTHNVVQQRNKRYWVVHPPENVAKLWTMSIGHFSHGGLGELNLIPNLLELQIRLN